jgi:hypothetical protein
VQLAIVAILIYPAFDFHQFVGRELASIFFRNLKVEV